MNQKAKSSPVKGVRRVGRAVILDCSGDVDLHRSALFQQDLLKALDERPERIVVNLKEVPYMDSSGVASLVKLLSRARKAEMPLMLVSPSDRVRSVLEITRLDRVFAICDTEEEALQLAE